MRQVKQKIETQRHKDDKVHRGGIHQWLCVLCVLCFLCASVLKILGVLGVLGGLKVFLFISPSLPLLNKIVYFTSTVDCPPKNVPKLRASTSIPARASSLNDANGSIVTVMRSPCCA